MSVAISRESQISPNVSHILKPKFIEWFGDIRGELEKSDRISQLVLKMVCTMHLANPIVISSRVDHPDGSSQKSENFLLAESRELDHAIKFDMTSPAVDCVDVWAANFDVFTTLNVGLDKASLFFKENWGNTRAYSLRCVVEAHIVKPDHFARLNKRVWDIKSALQKLPSERTVG